MISAIEIHFEVGKRSDFEEFAGIGKDFIFFLEDDIFFGGETTTFGEHTKTAGISVIGDMEIRCHGKFFERVLIDLRL